jgi:hypothetical protein
MTFNSAKVSAGAIAAMVFVSGASVASAQNAYYAGIAYSQSTGKIGYTVRQARTEEQAQRFAAANCGAPDAKTFIWGPNQWVAIAVVDAMKGTAGFGRGNSANEAQRKALDECAKRARGQGCRVALCIHSQGMRVGTLLSIPRDPNLPPGTPKSGFVAAIAYSPSSGKVGYTAGHARTKEDAQARALKHCGAPDAKVYMWGEEWLAIATADDRRGVAGFAPGATREAAEKAALEQCKKHGHGAPCSIALSVHSSGEKSSVTVAKPVLPPGSKQPEAPQIIGDPQPARPDQVAAPAAAPQLAPPAQASAKQ